MLANKKQLINEDDIARKMLNRMKMLKEDFENQSTNNEQPKKEVKIPQNDPYFVELKNNFNKFVGGVATDDNSLIVYPADNDVVFNGVISSMNGLKFQFRYNDQSGGLYMWADSALLNKDNVSKLNKLVVLKDQWYDYWTEHLVDFQK